MLDMGNLTVSNTFSKLNIQSDSGENPVVDDMNIELQNFKMSR